jgi:putative transposase
VASPDALPARRSAPNGHGAAAPRLLRCDRCDHSERDIRRKFESAGDAIVASPAWSPPAGEAGEAECREHVRRIHSPGGTIENVIFALMPDSYVANRVHCVFSTKNRTRIIPAEIQPRLWSFMAGIARENGIAHIAIGGFDDHAHVMIFVPPTVSLAKAMQLIKAGSSKWRNRTFANGSFEWQAGYSATSVSASLVQKTKAYIRNQRERHRTLGFVEEWQMFLERNGFSADGK